MANGNWTLITKQQLDDLDNKKQLEDSINEYMSIFKMYKQFHKQDEFKDDQTMPGFDNSLESIARLIAISQNSA